jgi:hypothetical protein
MTSSHFKQPAVPRGVERRQADIARRRFARAVRAEAAYLRALTAIPYRKRRTTASPLRDRISRDRP